MAEEFSFSALTGYNAHFHSLHVIFPGGILRKHSIRKRRLALLSNLVTKRKTINGKSLAWGLVCIFIDFIFKLNSVPRPAIRIHYDSLTVIKHANKANANRKQDAFILNVWELVFRFCSLTVVAEDGRGSSGGGGGGGGGGSPSEANRKQ